MRVDITTAFENAVNNSENRQANGHINWNFVDADVYMDVQPVCDKCHYSEFNRLAERYEDHNGIQLQDGEQLGIYSEGALEGLVA